MTSATAMMPRNCPSRSKKSGVFPCSARASACAFRVSGIGTEPEMNVPEPPVTIFPAMRPVRPLPARALKSVTSPAERFSFCPRSTIALARGCSLFVSSA